jgi:guanine deaminase
MQKKFMHRAIELARRGMENNEGGPFGCVVVKDEKIIAEGNNRVTSDNDPTAHAEVVAIRKACKKTESFQLEGCDIYTSCEPCPMCLGAIYWARPDRVFMPEHEKMPQMPVFDDDFIYNELDVAPGNRRIKMIPMEREKAAGVFASWLQKEDRVDY